MVSWWVNTTTFCMLKGRVVTSKCWKMEKPRNDGGNIINKPSWKYVSASFSGLVFRDSHPGVEYGCVFRKSHSQTCLRVIIYTYMRAVRQDWVWLRSNKNCIDFICGYQMGRSCFYGFNQLKRCVCRQIFVLVGYQIPSFMAWNWSMKLPHSPARI